MGDTLEAVSCLTISLKTFPRLGCQNLYYSSQQDGHVCILNQVFVKVLKSGNEGE